MKAAHNAFARWEYPVVSTASRAIRVINPGFREPGYPGNPAVF